MPAVTDAIATADRPKALERCLQSLAAGATLPDEVVLVDQSRSGATRAVADASPVRVTYLRDSGRGLGRAQNLAFAGADRRTLYVVGRGAVWKIRTLAGGPEGRGK